MDFGKIFDETMRKVLWFVGRFALQILDFAYNTLLSIFKLNVGDFPFIWNWFAGISILLFFFVLIRLSLMYFKTFYDDEEIERLSGIGILRRLMTIGIIMVMIPVVIPGLSSISSGLSEKFPAIVGEADDKPSSILIKSGMADFGNLNTDPPEIKLDEGQTLIDVITIDTINDKDGDAYKYFPNTENIALVLVLGVMCCYCYVFVCIQVAQRIVGMLLKILLAPYALSGLVDAKDNSTSIWFRMTMSDFIVNFFQMAMIWLSMVAAVAAPLTGLSKGLFFIGAVFAIMHSPAGISQLLGADVGASESFNQIQTGMAFMGASSMAMRVLGGATSYGAALGTYGAGRLLGGRTLNPSKILPILPGSGGSGGSGGGPLMPGGGSGGGVNMPSYNDSPTANQLKAASALGVPGAASMSKGELSQALENAGADDSYYNSSGSGGSFINDSQASGGETPQALSSFVNERGILSYSDGLLTRDGSYLRERHQTGVAGQMARNLAGHMYTRAAERIYAPNSVRMANARDRRFATSFTHFQQSTMSAFNTSSIKPTNNTYTGGNAS
jgi:hypothetical protein